MEEMEENWWTLDQVQRYLGYGSAKGTQTWLARHRIRSVRHWPVSEIIAARTALRSQAAQAGLARRNAGLKPLRRNKH